MSARSGAAAGNEGGDERDDTPSDEKMYTGEPLEGRDGTYRPQQQNAAGKDNIDGGGEWPDPNTPAKPPAPGAA